MRLSALTCIYDKPPEVERAVLEALLEHVDEVVAVFDRPKKTPLVWCNEPSKIMAIRLDGPPGWRSPCLSWNAGLKHVTGDGLLIVQGDVVLAPGSVDRIRHCLGIPGRPTAYFGKVTESDPSTCTGAGHAGPVLCSSTNPRPLTYLVALPTAAVKAIDGWDEAFQAGVWYEDDDFTARLYQYGLDFVFDDRISGTHQSHTRAYAKPINIAPNMALFLEKYGVPRFFDREIRLGRIRIHREPGRTEWRRP